MKRGEEAFDKLKELALHKMNLPENVKKGWPKKADLLDTFIDLKGEVKELKEALNAYDLYPSEGKKDELKLEIADVAAYCAILLDIL